MSGVRRHRTPTSHGLDLCPQCVNARRSTVASQAAIARARPMLIAHAPDAHMSGVRRHYTPMHTPPSHGLDPCLQRAHSTLTRRSHGRSAARVRRHRKPPSTRPRPPLRLDIRRTQSGVRWHSKPPPARLWLPYTPRHSTHAKRSAAALIVANAWGQPTRIVHVLDAHMGGVRRHRKLVHQTLT